MFNLFKTSSTEAFDNAFALMDKRWFDTVTKMKADFDKTFKSIEEQIEAAKTVQPIISASDDAVTVTFRGPNVTTTVTASKGNLPEVLKQFGLEMPTVATKKPAKKSAIDRIKAEKAGK